MSKLLAKLFFGALVIFCMSAIALGWFFAAPGHSGALSENFDGKYFHNEVEVHNGLITIFRWLIFRKPGAWTRITNKSYEKPVDNMYNKYRITFVNHSTMLIQVAGINILSDPIWSERCSPVSFAGPQRMRDPGVAFKELPKINLILISHNHYDHLDIPTLRKLVKRDDPLILVGLGIKKFLAKKNITKVFELDWWQEHNFAKDIAIFGVPAQHFSGRGIGDRNKTLWLGFVIKTKEAQIYFAGDTGFGPHFSQIYNKFGAIDLALLPIGAFLPIAVMRHMHMQPSEALKAAEILKARHSVGIHFGTFPLADDAQTQPLEELARAKALGAHESNFEVLDFGEHREY
jgi:L-ascorbate metabolism protein UlaG (beta-lactamase superfamily)